MESSAILEQSTQQASAAVSADSLPGAATGAGAETGGEAEADAGTKQDNDLGTRGVEAIWSLLGSPEGAPLRRIMKDLDSTDVFLRLAAPSRESRVIRRLIARIVAEALLRNLNQSAQVRSRVSSLAIVPLYWPSNFVCACF